MKSARSLTSLGLAAGLALLAAACDGRRETREILNMPDMHFSPALKAQQPDPWSPTGSSMRLPPEGTVPVGFRPYTITNAEADELASRLPNPLPATREVLRAGARYYTIYCALCHGDTGNGLGSIIEANRGMPLPPELYSDKLVNDWTDGRIFHTITVGQGNMPAYNTKMDPEQRWAVVHYVRALQRAALPTDEDIDIARERGALRDAE